MKKILIVLIALFSLVGCKANNEKIPKGCHLEQDGTMICTKEKPVIYLYPEVTIEVSVKLNLDGKLIFTYPEYKNGWTIIAEQDGTLRDLETNKEYSYLFWEGISENNYDFSEGFVVKGKDTTEFLQNILPEIGLLPHEYNEFIVYWAPRMEQNKYNLISFQKKNYEASAELQITPAPDNILRVFMAYKAIEEPIEIQKQSFEEFNREGFVVVEWGGAEVVEE